MDLKEIASWLNIDTDVAEGIVLLFDSVDDVDELEKDLDSRVHYLPSVYGFWMRDGLVNIDHDFMGRPYGLLDILVDKSDLISHLKDYVTHHRED
ncbi:hypothetical protein ACFP81_00780 [Deinococcus lacus]|uniref:Uncharacterized protein n=1 Tax=Deinococcus lacus TaxID=392561 RepID=A0ABW1Y9A6_9DEIO